MSKIISFIAFWKERLTLSYRASYLLSLVHRQSRRFTSYRQKWLTGLRNPGRLFCKKKVRLGKKRLGIFSSNICRSIVNLTTFFYLKLSSDLYRSPRFSDPRLVELFHLPSPSWWRQGASAQIFDWGDGSWLGGRIQVSQNHLPPKFRSLLGFRPLYFGNIGKS